MENLDTLPTSLTLNVDGKPVVVKIPALIDLYSRIKAWDDEQV
jgi:hypothetical protein